MSIWTNCDIYIRYKSNTGFSPTKAVTKILKTRVDETSTIRRLDKSECCNGYISEKLQFSCCLEGLAAARLYDRIAQAFHSYSSMENPIFWDIYTMIRW